jgi:hypothetical protein
VKARFVSLLSILLTPAAAAPAQSSDRLLTLGITAGCPYGLAS